MAEMDEKCPWKIKKTTLMSVLNLQEYLKKKTKVGEPLDSPILPVFRPNISDKKWHQLIGFNFSS
jgi:hypothetical protein